MQQLQSPLQRFSPLFRAALRPIARKLSDVARKTGDYYEKAADFLKKVAYFLRISLRLRKNETGARREHAGKYLFDGGDVEEIGTFKAET